MSKKQTGLKEGLAGSEIGVGLVQEVIECQKADDPRGKGVLTAR